MSEITLKGAIESVQNDKKHLVIVCKSDMNRAYIIKYLKNTSEKYKIFHCYAYIEARVKGAVVGNLKLNDPDEKLWRIASMYEREAIWARCYLKARDQMTNRAYNVLDELR